MTTKLKIGWKVTTVGAVSTLLRGVGYQKVDAEAQPTEKNCLVLRGGNIQDGKIFINDDVVFVPRELVKEEQFLRRGDVIIVGSTGSKDLIGKAALSIEDQNKVAFGAFLMLLRPSEQIDKKYFGYFFLTREYRDTIRKLSAGVNINNIRREHITSIPFPIPPLPEQKRIVAKLDTLFAHLDQLKARLQNIPILLKQFRQAVLTQAVTGKLTEEWRRERVLDSECDLKMTLSTKQSLIIDGRLKRNKLEPVKDEHLIEDIIPHFWSKAILDDIFSFIDYRGKTPQRTISGKRLITAKNIKMGCLSDEPIEFMSDSAFKKWMTRGFPKVGDIFFVTEGHTMGNVAINNRTDDFALAQRTITLQPFSRIASKFFLYVILTREFQEFVKQNATGTAAVGIKASKFKNLIVPFPSFEEQAEIVRIVEALFAVADRIEASYKTLQEKIAHLPHAILSKAFRGELVPQDNKETPTSALLKSVGEKVDGMAGELEVELAIAAEPGVKFKKKKDNASS